MPDFAHLSHTRLHYELAGNGLAVVFIHAGIGDLRMWDDQFAHVAQHYRALRYDVRSFGQSPNPEGMYYDHEELRELLDFLGIHTAVLVGASGGGRIAIDFAVSYPQRVAGLVLVCAVAGGYEFPPEEKAKSQRVGEVYRTGDIPGAIEFTLQQWVDGPQRTPAQVDPTVRERVWVMTEHMFRIPDEEDLGEMQAVEPPPITRLSDITAPTLVIQGALDVACMIPHAKQLAREIPHATLEIIADAAHLPNMEQPERFNALLDAFLARIIPPIA
jgi:3-oxoadipate enol-lactonase